MIPRKVRMQIEKTARIASYTTLFVVMFAYFAIVLSGQILTERARRAQGPITGNDLLRALEENETRYRVTYRNYDRIIAAARRAGDRPLFQYAEETRLNEDEWGTE